MVQRRSLIQAAAGSALLASIGQRAFAQAFEQAKILYGFPAGSAGDIAARRVADKLGGTPSAKNAPVVENKPGAGGRIALTELKAAPGDGSVLAMTPFSCVSIYPHIYKSLAYDPVKDIVPVHTSSMIYHGFCAGPLVPASVTNVKTFLEWAKANPTLANYGSPAAGSTPHFIGALLGLNHNVDLKHVPYRGSVPGITDVVGGQIASMFCPSGDMIANHKAGKLRVLATSGTVRSPFLPDVPTFAEQGLSELTVEEWFGFYAPAKTPPAVIAAASSGIAAALKDKAVVDSLAVVGLLPYSLGTDDMAKSQKAEADRWGPLVKKIGFTAES